MTQGSQVAVKADDDVVAIGRARKLEQRVRELGRLLGARRWRLILKEALTAAREKKRVWQLPSPSRSSIRFAAQPP